MLYRVARFSVRSRSAAVVYSRTSSSRFILSYSERARQSWRSLGRSPNDAAARCEEGGICAGTREMCKRNHKDMHGRCGRILSPDRFKE